MPNPVLRRSSLWKTTRALLMASALLVMPLAALAAPPAQEGTLDPVVVAAVVRSAAIVAGRSGAAGAAAPVDEPVDAPVDEPVDEPVAREEIVIGATVEVNAEGISLLAPENWALREDDDGALLSFADEATGFRIEVNDSGGDFPGMLILPIIEGNVDAFLATFGDDAELVSMTRSLTEDGLPILRVGYTGADGDEGIADGALYFVVLGADVLAIFAGVGDELWPAYETATDELVASILVDRELMTMTQAGDKGDEVGAPNGDFTLTVPPGWFYSPTADETMGVTVADPTLGIVGAMMATGLSPSEEELLLFTRATAGEIDSDEMQEMLEEIVGGLNLGSDDAITVDESRIATFPGGERSAGTLRIVGDVEVEEGVLMAITMYMTIFPSEMAALVFFGAPDAVEAEEATILELLESIQLPE